MYVKRTNVFDSNYNLWHLQSVIRLLGGFCFERIQPYGSLHERATVKPYMSSLILLQSYNMF